MKAKYIRSAIWLIIALVGYGYACYKGAFPAVGLTGTVLIIAEFCLEKFLDSFFNSIKDIFERPGWKKSLRDLQRQGIVKENDYIRISFAYLFRIKIGDKYFLVKNDRGTQKFQPVGGAYKFNDREKRYLTNTFYLKDDTGIRLDEKSKNDYRLYIMSKYLKKFVKRFDKTPDREQISDLSREVKEELNLTSQTAFHNTCYRYCGRHFTDVEYSRFFNCYELLLADIVELNLSKAQEEYLQDLVISKPNKYILTTVDKIKSCGVEAGTDNLLENIADHTVKILQETEPNLIKIRKYMKNEYKVTI